MDEKDENGVNPFRRVECRNLFRRMENEEYDECMKNNNNQTLPNTDNNAGDDVLTQQQFQPENVYNSPQMTVPPLPQPNMIIVDQNRHIRYCGNIGSPDNTLIVSTTKNAYAPEYSYTETMYYDDPNTCAMYKVKVSKEEKHEISTILKGNHPLIAYDEYRNKLKDREKKEKLANIYHERVIKYGDWYSVRVRYKRRDAEQSETKTVHISKYDAARSKICSKYREAGISCGERNISNAIFELYTIKSVEKEGPKKCGFSIVKGRFFFASKQSLEANEYPPITEKSLDLNCDSEMSVYAIFETFNEVLASFDDPNLAMLLNLIRLTALLTSVFAEIGIRFRRFIAIDCDDDIIRYMLHIYDIDPNKKKLSLDDKYLDLLMSDLYDEAAIFKGSVKKPQYAAELINELYSTVYSNTDGELGNDKKHSSLSHDYIVVLTSEFLGSLLNDQQVLHLNYNKDSLRYKCELNDVDEANMILNLRIIRTVQNDENIKEFLLNNYKRYLESDIVSGKSYANDYAVIMTVYSLLSWAAHKYALMLSETEVQEYLIDTFENSMRHEKLANICDEFKSKLNELVINDEIKILANSKGNEVQSVANDIRIIYYRDDLLLITNDVFKYIVDDMKLPENENQVRKAIKSYLKYDKSGAKNTYKYTVRLYHNNEGDSTKVTAVKSSVLRSDARLKILWNFESVTNTDDGIERVYIGSDESGQKFYWSLGHKQASKCHMVFVGQTQMGKSCAMNHIAKQLYEKGHKVIYICFKNADPKNQLLGHGFSEEYYNNNCIASEIKEVNGEISFAPDNNIISDIFDSGKNDNKINILYWDKYSERIEKVLRMLYDIISSDGEKEAFIVIDEAHKLSHKKESVLYDMYNMGKGNGIHLLTAYQTFSQVTKSESDIIQYDIIAHFAATNSNDGKKIAERYGMKPYTDFGNQLVKLEKQQCFLIGEIENSNGEINRGCKVKVRIPDANS